MNTPNQNPEGATGMKKLAGNYKQAADELAVRINRLSVVSQDTAYREGFNLSALRRAQDAAETDKVFLGGNARGILILGISSLGPEKAEKFIGSCGGWKSHANSALLWLDGEKGEIRKNKAGTCWVIDLASSRRTVMFGWTSGPREVRLAGPRLNTTNGGAHWCGLLSETTPFNAEKSPNAVAFLQRAKNCWAEHGMTPMQWQEAENARRQVEAERRGAILRAAQEAAGTDGAKYCLGGYGPQYGEEYRVTALAIAGDSGSVPENLAELIRLQIASNKLAAEETRIMAELEAEQTRLSEEKAKTETEVKQQAEIAAACRASGISPAQWQGMNEKQRRLALHRARLVGKI